MKCGFVFADAPLSIQHSGAASRYAQNYWSLREACDELHVVRLCSSANQGPVFSPDADFADGQAASRAASSWHDITATWTKLKRSRLHILLQSIRDPLAYKYPFARENAVRLQRVLERFSLDFLWVEHSEPAASVSLMQRRGPWIYSHLDMLDRVYRIRHKVRTPREKWILSTIGRAERVIDRAPSLIVTGSTTEAARLRRLTPKPVHVIPIAYPTMVLSQDTGVSRNIRLVHLGSLETTANRHGLAAYLTMAHDHVMALFEGTGIDVSLWVIGSHSQVKTPLAELLRKPGVILKGYISDLSSVLRPCDIALLPYETDTGYRTKLPLLLQYSQVIVATRAALAGVLSPELESACVLTTSISEFPKAILNLALDFTKRTELAAAGRHYFENQLSYRAVQHHYDTLLNELQQTRASLHK